MIARFAFACGRSIFPAALLSAFLCTPPAFAQTTDPRPEQFPVTRIYKGKAKAPDFKGRDKDFASFRTRIRNGMKEGPNFAGEYTIIQVGCGAGCSFAMVANNRTGQIFDFPRGGEDNMYLSLRYVLDSALVVAKWASYETQKCTVEHFRFDQGKWSTLAKRDVGDMDACYRTLDENAP